LNREDERDLSAEIYNVPLRMSSRPPARPKYNEKDTDEQGLSQREFEGQLLAVSELIITARVGQDKQWVITIRPIHGSRPVDTTEWYESPSGMVRYIRGPYVSTVRPVMLGRPGH
jgi:hypothetical protein